MSTSASEAHSAKARSPISTMLTGIMTSSSALQPSNADAPIELTPLEITSSVSAAQRLKQFSGMSFTLPGMTTVVSFLQFSNAPSPIPVTDPGIMTLYILALLKAPALIAVTLCPLMSSGRASSLSVHLPIPVMTAVPSSDSS